MQVRDFMITRFHTVKPSHTLKELLHILHTNRIGGVPVVDDRGHLIGMVSDGDVLRYLAPRSTGFASILYSLENIETENTLQEKLGAQVKEIMTKKNLISVSPDREYEETLRLVSKRSCKILPVINGAGRVIGVLTKGDIISDISKKII